MKTRILLLAALFIVVSSRAGRSQSAPPTADKVLADAYAQAGKEHKNVILIFHASWCGWCKKMEASLNDPTCKKMFDDNYVIVTLDVMEQPAKVALENPGSSDQLKKYNGDKAGLPFWVVLDAKGN